MIGKIHNREAFLNRIGKRLGRTSPLKEAPSLDWNYQPQEKTLTNLSANQLVDILKEQCTRIHTKVYETTKDELKTVLTDIIHELGSGRIVIPNDRRFTEYQIMEAIQKEASETHIWNHSLGKVNVKKAEVANISITFSEMTLAESGTVVLFNTQNHGRSIAFLPTSHISIIPKSTIVPRMTQAAQIIDEKVINGEIFPSNIQFITGPSNSADIEMNLVVGVHGPVKATYIIVED